MGSTKKIKMKIYNNFKFYYLLLVLLTGTVYAYGFLTHNLWFVGILLFISAIIILIHATIQWQWFPDVYLLVHVVFSIAGILTQISSYLMIVGAACALITWELSDVMALSNQDNITRWQVNYHRYRFLLLITSVGMGLIFSIFIMTNQTNIPFFGMFILALLILLSVIRIYQLTKN